MQHNRIKPMVEGGILSAVAVLFALISAYLPVLGDLVMMIWPVPIILLGVRHGYKWSILATVASGLIIAATINPMLAVGIVVGMGLIGIVLGYALRSGYTALKIMAFGSVASLLSKLLVVAISIYVMGLNPITTQLDQLEQGVRQGMDIYRNLGINEETITTLSEQMQGMVGLMKVIMPVLLLIASVVDTFLNFKVACLMLKKLGQPVAVGFPPFKYWGLSKYMLYFFFVSVAVSIGGQAAEFKLLSMFGANLQVITSIALLLQGLALFSFFADKYSLSRVLRWLILFLIFTNPFVSQMAVFAGAFDLIFDYRKLRMRTGKE